VVSSNTTWFATGDRTRDLSRALSEELLCQSPEFDPPSEQYCSLHNPGAVELMYEVAREQPGFEVMVTQNAEDLTSCERMLIYLTDQTWTRGATSDAFAVEVCSGTQPLLIRLPLATRTSTLPLAPSQVELAMKRGTPLLLCHEMPGVDGRSERHGCPFDFFLAEGATPEFLKDVGIYSRSNGSATEPRCAQYRRPYCQGPPAIAVHVSLT
jgi:hypothetical protein